MNLKKVIYTLKNVMKTYESFSEITHALDNVSFELYKGQVIVILGPSGSGKSTMLNVLSGIDNPTSGQIIFDKVNIEKMSEKELTEYREKNLGFIFQSYNLIPNLTVYENVELGSHLSENTLDIAEILEIVGLSEMKHKFPYQLSGGQMQRVAIARAVAKNPKVLFCDEPTGALDEKVGKQTLKLLQDINKKYNTTVIIVTHNPAIALLANMVIKMNSGKVVSITENENTIDANEIGWA
ncbi:MAG: ABC transporter ATP-binding protein [Clostridia bacterium]|nr:ABC transporter ATP-binding protein [Clostridia bacterium]